MRSKDPAGGPLVYADTDDEIDLREYWRILLERRNIAFACVGVSLVLGLLFTFLAVPEYRATTTLQIERQGPDVLTFQDVMGVDPAGYKDFYQTQYKIIESHAVLRLAAERIDLPNHPEFVARKGTPVGRMFRWAKSLLSGPAEERDELDRAVRFIEDELAVRPVRNSQLVEISFMDRDAGLARDLTNAIADAYQQFSRESRYSTTGEASDFLTKQVARLQSEIAVLERELQDYGNENEILALSAGTQDITEQALAELNHRLSQARAQLAGALARYESVQDSSPDSMPEVLNSNLINSLKQGHAELERRYTQMADRFKPEWPALQEIREELNQAQARLTSEADSIAVNVRESARTNYERSQAEVGHLQDQVDKQKRLMQRVSVDAIEYAGLQSEIQTRRDVLNDLVTRQSQTKTSEQLQDTSASNIRVVDRADLPDRPARPRKALNLLLALALGSCTGLGMAFLLHYVDNTIKSEQDIERYAPGVAVLGHVPLLLQLRASYGRSGRPKKPDEPTPMPNPDFGSHQDPRSSYAEAFKNLRTSLLLASPEHPPRRIAVTSCEPSDGKSTIAINLATVLAQMGRKVLLVDADLRRPRVAGTFGLRKDVGLSSALSGNADFGELFRETEIPNLDVITSGPIPPNPSELLDSPVLEEFLERVEAQGFDHIVLDCPPVIQVADSLILSAVVQATILVVRAGSTSRDSLERGVTRLRQTRAHVIGAVLNAVSESSRYYYSYRHYRHDGPDSDFQAPPETEKKSRLRASQG